jgi:hypothetical protein
MGYRKKEAVKRASGVLCAFLFSAWGLSACGDNQVAGGYDDVENPSILVAVADSTGLSAGAGTVSLYARFQNPFQDSLPILALPAKDSLRLRDSTVREAFARARELGIPFPSVDTLGFNLIAIAPSGEAFLDGYALVRKADVWAFRRLSPGSVAYPDAQGVLSSRPILRAPVLGQRGQIGPKGMELGLKRVFVPGSPYKAELAGDGSFVIARIAAGRYELKAVAGDDKIYTALDSLAAGTDYQASDWSEADVIWVTP